MPDRDPFSGYIDECLCGTGLNEERRSEAAAEFREHLDQLASHHRETTLATLDGLRDALARQLAMQEFGAVSRIRWQLTLGQWREDIRFALWRWLRLAWLPILAAALVWATPGLLPAHGGWGAARLILATQAAVIALLGISAAIIVAEL